VVESLESSVTHRLQVKPGFKALLGRGLEVKPTLCFHAGRPNPNLAGIRRLTQAVPKNEQRRTCVASAEPVAWMR